MLGRIGRLLGIRELTPRKGLIHVSGDTVPTDTSTGYATGCIFAKLDGGVSTAIYINEGSYSSSDFNALSAGLGILDAGGLITATTIEGALQELAKHNQTAQAIVDLPIGSAVEKDGTALAVWGDGANSQAGWNTEAEAGGVRWDPNANPDPIKVSIPIPPDLDASEDVILHISGAKFGATSGDTVNWTVEAFNNVVGALWDADASFGGECGDLTNTTKLVQESTLTLAAANVVGSPAVLTVTIQPKDGKLGTDDAMIFGMWLEYTRKTLTS